MIFRTYSSCTIDFKIPTKQKLSTVPPSKPWQPPFYSFFLLSWVLYILCTGEIIQYCPFMTDISFSIMSSRSIHVVQMMEFPSFAKLNNTPLYVYTTFSLSIICQSTFRLFLYLYHHEWYCNKYEYRYLFEIPTPISLDKYPGVWWLDYVVILFIYSSWGISILYSIVSVPFYISTYSVPGYQFLNHLYQHSLSFVFQAFLRTILLRYSWFTTLC